MFQLQVHHRGSGHPAPRVAVGAASDVMEAVERLLEEHPGCLWIEVWFGGARLFRVEGEGEQLAKAGQA